MLRVRAALAALLLLLLGSSRLARAHDETVSASELEVKAATLTWRADVGTAGLAKVVSFPAPLSELTEGELQATGPAIGVALARGLSCSLDGTSVAPKMLAIAPQYEPSVASGQPYIARAVVTFRFVAAAPVAAFRCRVAFFSELTAMHRSMITVRWEGQLRQFARLGPTEISMERQRPPLGMLAGSWAVVREFLPWGMHHIFVGYDHIAFLLALLLAVVKLTDLLKIVTSFTVAHSLTILLAALGLVHIPARITEVLIAASIIFVAVENLSRPSGLAPRHRWIVTFAFGLVHGLGFATELRARLAGAAGHVLIPVIAFNLGVETGQVIIVLLLFPLLWLLRRAPDDPARRRHQVLIARWGSLPILLLGLWWFVERVRG